jgi:hypothetical protein
LPSPELSVIVELSVAFSAKYLQISMICLILGVKRAREDVREVVPLASADGAASAKTAFNLGKLAVDSALLIAYLTHFACLNISLKSQLARLSLVIILLVLG